MEYRFIDGAVLLVGGNGRQEDFKLAKLFMFQAMGLLVQARPEWPAELKREKLHPG